MGSRTNRIQIALRMYRRFRWYGPELYFDGGSSIEATAGEFWPAQPVSVGADLWKLVQSASSLRGAELDSRTFRSPAWGQHIPLVPRSNWGAGFLLKALPPRDSRRENPSHRRALALSWT